MLTIFDYIRGYRDIPIEEVEWNIMDNLICSILVYLPINEFRGTKDLIELYDEVIKVREIDKLGSVEPETVNVLKLMLNTNRYRKMKLTNLVKLKNNNTQFGASTFRLNDITVISFQGTDYSTIGWLENFRLAYEYPTYTQKLAIEYLKNNLRLLADNNVYVVGHSKGGNLAMTSVMESSNRIYKKIKKVYNFDGPGFRDEEYKTEKYKRLSEKLINVVPEGSVIGVLLNNKNYEVIKTNAIGFNEHYPTNWCVLGSTFEKGKLSFIGKKLQQNTTEKIKEVNPSRMKEAIETLFEDLNENKTSDIKLSLENIIKIYSNLKLAKKKAVEPLGIIFDSMTEVICEKDESNIGHFSVNHNS